MAIKPMIRDNDPYYLIDIDSRTITRENGGTEELVQYDNDSERLTFKIPNNIEGHPVQTCERIEIHYKNIGAGTSASVREVNEDFYVVDDCRTDPNDPEMTVFTWLVSQNATQLAGTITFQIHFISYPSDPVFPAEVQTESLWSTKIYSALNVSEGLNCTQLVLEQNPDIIRHFDERIINLENNIAPSTHSHDNKDVLDKLNSTPKNKLTFDGETLVTEDYVTWNNVKDRPFGDTRKFSDINVVYDTDTVATSAKSDALYTWFMDLPEFSKISDFTSEISVAHFSSGLNVISTKYNRYSPIGHSSFICVFGDVNNDFNFVVISEEDVGTEISINAFGIVDDYIFPKAGMYTNRNVNVCFGVLTFIEFVNYVNVIDVKYLPECAYKYAYHISRVDTSTAVSSAGVHNALETAKSEIRESVKEDISGYKDEVVSEAKAYTDTCKTAAVSEAVSQTNESMNAYADSFNAEISSIYEYIDTFDVDNGLPSVDSSNEGQFARVVDGKWAAVTIPIAEEGEF